ncbi:hypothetical protein H7F10_13550 [Acidithiobacillus sp. HP-6]|uniref:beta strand repeat-containing protein n=1 Tax=unclassified Acidithiobacillus TaxID=2614800 RepID=UPI00187AD4CB|nr:MULTISPECIES: hypothetical protein [unclassified Acidithiobacillus]MBE7563940.1 hypothetical protein [Acidithiobacillus sp. HP-6]MBE7570660.1 hypothetical protein [Acidithiobacillus sp. HP-2]
MNHKARLQDNIPVSNGESGAVLLLSVIVLAILLGFIAWSTLSTTKTALTSAYQMTNDNQARVAALVGVSALTQYANGIYQHANDASNGSSTCSQGGGLLGSILSPICNVATGLVSGMLGNVGTSTPIPNGGNGGVAVYMHPGTTAQATLSNTAPFLGATVSAYVLSNTFTPAGSLSNPPTASAPGLITIVSQGASGHARATAVAVLGVASPGSGAGSAQGNIPVNLNGDTTFGGNINLIGGSNSSLSTSGNLTSSGSFTGFNTIISTKSMNLSGSSGAGNLFSDQSITITGSGNYGSLKSLQNVTIGGSVNAQIIQTNGTTTLNSSSKVSTITSIGDVTLQSGTAVSNLSTQANVSATNATVGIANVQGDYSESSNGSAASGNAGGLITFPSSNHNVNLTHTPGLQVPITPLTAATLSSPTVNAAAMKSLANYAFTLPPSGSAAGIIATVVVQNVNGIPSGTYYLYDGPSNSTYNDYLVTSNSSSFPSPLYKIGSGYSDYNPDITYNNGTWTLAGNSGSTSDIAPGVLWFSGNVKVADGTYYNSIIATGNITTAGSSQVYAVNYAGGTTPPQNVCSNTGYSTGGILGIGATTINPSNFCGTSSTSTFNPASIGNIALLAGGDITLGSSNAIYGDVIAGDVINTSGSTTIFGYLTSAGMAGGTNSFGASTTINVQNLPSTFTPTVPVTWSNTAPASTSSGTSLMLKSLYWE